MFKYGSIRKFFIKSLYGAAFISFSIIYLGSLLSYSEGDPGFKTFSNNTNAYCFSYPSAPYVWIKYTIDAQDHGNEIRFLNHSETPNCEAIGVCVDGLLHIIVRTTRLIYKEEELCYHYGEQYWKGYEKNKFIQRRKSSNAL